MRKCVACQENKPKKELIRIVRTPEGEVSVDQTGKKSGRGAYICNEPACFDKAKKRNILSTHLSTPITEDVYDVLKESVAAKE
jgi:predicted RNA-binding protein YlxR (DUF448 family)